MTTTIIHPDFDQIRQVFGGLSDEPRWVAWAEEVGRNGKPTKIPKNPRTGGNASTTNPSTWGTLVEAEHRMERDALAGIGCVFNGDGLGGTDLDGCRNPVTGEIDEWAMEFVREQNSYAEVSPSGCGLKIFLAGAPRELPSNEITLEGVPNRYGKEPGIEAYVGARYFAVTGAIIPDVPDEIRQADDFGDAWDLMLARLRGQSGNGNGRKPDPREQEGGEGLPDDIDDLLAAIPADCRYGTWLAVLMAIHHADPSERGFQVVNTWSAGGGDKYDGAETLRTKWESFGKRNGSRVTTIGTVRHLAEHYGYCRSKPQEGDGEDDPTLTDTGNATRLVRLHGERLRYVPAWGRYLVWNTEQGRWIEDPNSVYVRELAKDVGRKLKMEAADIRDAEAAKKTFAFAFQSLNAPRISAMVDLARGIKGIPLDHDLLDNDAWLMGVTNGVLDLKTGGHRAARPEDLMTMQCPVPWAPDATAPRWEQAMEEWFPDPDVRAYVQRVAGSALVGAQRNHVFVIHFGGGRNGKGTFVRAMKATLGRYFVMIHLSLLVEQKYKEHDTVKADLFRKRLAVASETKHRVKLDEANVKNLTGADPVKARRMREDLWEFDPSHSLWLQTNYLPEIAGRDRGIWSRIRVVKWVSTFEGAAADTDLDEKLAAEAPGILRWLVDGCLRWQERGLDEPEGVVRETLAYRKAEDVFARFQNDVGLVFRADLQLEAQELQDLLVQWARGEGFDPPKQNVGTWLEENGCRKTQRRVRDQDGRQRRPNLWLGVGLDDGDHESEQTDALV